jgi:iron complex outermembrane recepter protein
MINTNLINIILSLTFVLCSMPLHGQDNFSEEVEVEELEGGQLINITGNVTDATNGKALAGANIIVEDSDVGSASDEEGNYTLEGVESGSNIIVTVIGYTEQSIYADTETLNFSMTPEVIELNSLEVLASRAGSTTPVAFTNIAKEEINLRLGSRDIPLAMNTVPGVYSTGQGGGAGDARINVRGFNQRNVAIMLNGIPVNDMENGWVYWSNWDGLADATSSIQMQKGLSAQNLATPSVGGSMNIITDPSAQERRGLFKQELGAWGFLKTTLSYHSGMLLDDKLAVSGTLVRKTGTGYSKGTWTDASAYYIDATYNLNNDHRLQFYALGAPQRHGQNIYAQNMAAYDVNFAKSMDNYSEDALTDNGGEFMEIGRDFNQNVADLSEASQGLLDAAGGQHWEMYSVRDGVDRHETDNLSERENFFHKPLAALNHYWNINEKMDSRSSVYWSGGKGGGTGTYGDVARIDANGISDLRSEKHKFYYGPSPWTWDWNGTIAANASSSSEDVIFQGDTVSRGNKESIGILRNSNNRQSTIGLISKLDYEVSNSLKTQVGVDWRTAKIYHVKTIRDLLGGEYFVNTDSEFDAENQQKGLGDPIDYNFTNMVDWLGLFGQFQYDSGALSSYGMAGIATVKYSHWNHFKKASNYNFTNQSSKDGSGSDWVSGNGSSGGNDGELYIEADAISSSQVKGGLMYSFGNSLSFMNAIPVFGKLYDNTDFWFNFGLVDKAPIMDQVIYEDDGDVYYGGDSKNEKFTAFEFGFNLSSNDGTMASKLNVYSLTWSDRVQSINIPSLDGDDNLLFLEGINQQHSGVEVELSWQAHEMVRLDVGVGLGKWLYTDDATGTYRDGGNDVTYSYALKDLKVGDQPQSNLILGTTITPIEGAKIQFLYRYYGTHYSAYEPTSREFDGVESNADRRSSWDVPSYGVLDFHGSYDLPFEFGSAKPRVFMHVFNAFDEVYIQDATDNSKYNSWSNGHNASDAEVYFGLPMSFNVGLSIAF